MEIERLEDWVGQQVVDPDGEKVGKLEDVFYSAGGSDALAVSVKTGGLRRKVHLVPLDGATVSREHVSVAYGRDAIHDAPEAPSDSDLASSTVATLGTHFGVALPQGELESGAARRAREARAREAEERATELERVADEKKGEAERQNEQAAQSRDAAATAERERQEALDKAAQARRDAGE